MSPSQYRALQATAYTLTDQLHQVLQLTYIRCLDALKPGWPVFAIDIDAAQEEDLKVNIEIQRRSEAQDDYRWKKHCRGLFDLPVAA